MGLSKKLKTWVKARYAGFVKIRNGQDWRNQITKAEKKCADEIPELTGAQKKEIRKYWKRYGIDVPCFDWHRFFYMRTGLQRPDFIPKILFNYDVKPFLSDLRLSPAWSDKSYLDFFLRDVNTPVNIVRSVNGHLLDKDFNEISQSEADEVMRRFDALVIKPTVFTNTGKGVQLLKPPYRIADLTDSYKRDFVIQLPLRQHEEMAKLNESSVNTIRVNSVFIEGEAHVMSCFVKVGQTGEFADNNGKERYFIGIKTPEGIFNDYAIDHDMVSYRTIPSGYDFAGQKVPSFEKMCQMVCKAHKQLAHFGLAFWDVCIDEDGEPCIVEVNLTAPDSAIAQAACGPFFGDYSDQVLDYVRRRNEFLNGSHK